ncbi:MAG: hypothetical protein U0797_04700 [Gemmataceae bacterium]
MAQRGLLDGGLDAVEAGDVQALRGEEEGVLAAAAADVEHLALEPAAGVQPDDVVLRPADVPRGAPP